MRIAEIAKQLARESIDATFVIAPLVWVPSDGVSAKRWRFMVARKTRRGFGVAEIMVPDEPVGIMTRTALAGALIGPGVIIHVADDELAAARLSVIIWPSKKSRGVVAAMEAEDKARGERLRT